MLDLRKNKDPRESDIHEALVKWQETRRYFESVNDPDLIEYAVYEMEAARRKYVLLLKRYAAEEYSQQE